MPKELTYRGITVSKAAKQVIDKLTTKQLKYISHPNRKTHRGFAAIGEFCDHNTLLPFANDFTGTAEQIAFYNAVTDEVTKRAISFHNAIQTLDL